MRLVRWRAQSRCSLILFLISNSNELHFSSGSEPTIHFSPSALRQTLTCPPPLDYSFSLFTYMLTLSTHKISCYSKEGRNNVCLPLQRPRLLVDLFALGQSSLARDAASFLTFLMCVFPFVVFVQVSGCRRARRIGLCKQCCWLCRCAPPKHTYYHLQLFLAHRRLSAGPTHAHLAHSCCLS